MAKTQLADVIIPDVFEQYVIERTAEMANFGESGIVQRTAEFDALAGGPGKTVEMPFWQDLTGARQIISDSDDGDTNKIAAGQDAARIHNDFQSWSTNLLADLMAGDKGMDAIIDLVAAYWQRVDETMLIASVNGVLAHFDTLSGDPNLLKIASETIAATTDDTVLTGYTFIDAKQKLGDAKDRLVAIAMHSATHADLMKQDLIEFTPQSEGKPDLERFQGLAVIKDDSMPVRAGTTDGYVYTSVVFGMGAFARGFNPLTDPIQGGFGTQGVELARDPLGHDSILINRRRHILHPRGVAWVEEPAGGSAPAKPGGPNDVELATAAHWLKKWEAKNIRVVGILHNLANQVGAAS